MCENEEQGERDGELLEQQQHGLNRLCMDCDRQMSIVVYI